jgi:hypothetical protein
MDEGREGWREGWMEREENTKRAWYPCRRQEVHRGTYAGRMVNKWIGEWWQRSRAQLTGSEWAGEWLASYPPRVTAAHFPPAYPPASSHIPACSNPPGPFARPFTGHSPPARHPGSQPAVGGGDGDVAGRLAGLGVRPFASLVTARRKYRGGGGGGGDGEGDVTVDLDVLLAPAAVPFRVGEVCVRA